MVKKNFLWTFFCEATETLGILARRVPFPDEFKPNYKFGYEEYTSSRLILLEIEDLNADESTEFGFKMYNMTSFEIMNNFFRLKNFFFEYWIFLTFSISKPHIFMSMYFNFKMMCGFQNLDSRTWLSKIHPNGARGDVLFYYVIFSK